MSSVVIFREEGTHVWGGGANVQDSSGIMARTGVHAVPYHALARLINVITGSRPGSGRVSECVAAADTCSVCVRAWHTLMIRRQTLTSRCRCYLDAGVCCIPAGVIAVPSESSFIIFHSSYRLIEENHTLSSVCGIYIKSVIKKYFDYFLQQCLFYSHFTGVI